MGVITLTLEDSVEKKLRKAVSGKGSLGKAISQATKEWLEKEEQKALAKKGLDLLKKGWPMGKIMATREELHDR